VGSDDPTCLSLSVGVMVSGNDQVPLGWNSNMLVGPDDPTQFRLKRRSIRLVQRQQFESLTAILVCE